MREIRDDGDEWWWCGPPSELQVEIGKIDNKLIVNSVAVERFSGRSIKDRRGMHVGVGRQTTVQRTARRRIELLAPFC